MKLKMLGLLVLLGALLVSASVGTLSGFYSSSTFSTSITVDMHSIKGHYAKEQLSAGQELSGQENKSAQPDGEQQAIAPEHISE